MEAKFTTSDFLTFLIRKSKIFVGKCMGAYYGFLMGFFKGALWGWRYLCVNPIAVFVMEPGAKLELKGTLSVGYSLKPDVPLPGKQRTGLVIKKGGMFCAGDGVKLAIGSTVHVSPNASVEIGARTFVNYDTIIVSRERIKIGSDCAISWGVSILDSHLHTIEGVPYSQAVTIGSSVWIGHGVSILQGVSIGDGAIIGANSLVTKNIPERTLAAGSPAHVIRENVSWKI